MDKQADNAQKNASSITSAKPATVEHQEWEKRYQTKTYIWSTQVNATLAEEVQGLSAGKALDLAAGEGRNAVWLASEGWQVDAVDFSEQALSKAEALARDAGVASSVTCKQADLLEFEPQEQSYDLVIMMFFHIPIADLPPVLLRAAQAVAPGGTFILVGHDYDNLEQGYGGPQRADILYSAQFVAEIIKDEIAVEKAEQVKRPIKHDGSGDKMALDCLVRGRKK